MSTETAIAVVIIVAGLLIAGAIYFSIHRRM
jgi:hypothetical protein